MNERTYIIGDAGGTGTQWRILKGLTIHQRETIGFNPYTHDLHDFKKDVSKSLDSFLDHDPCVYLYAAGVGTPEQKRTLTLELEDVLGNNLLIENDLVGVARALCGDQPGNACILGTGANACFYDGKEVNTVSASLGFVLGDEGSGAYLGKKLLSRVFRGQFDVEILNAFHSTYDLTEHEVISQIYNQPRPNQFLSSFAHFVSKHKNHPEVYELIYQSFVDFFHGFFPKEDKNNFFYFSGSIAWYFSDILREVGKNKGVIIQNIIQSPIAGLALYHQKHG